MQTSSKDKVDTGSESSSPPDGTRADADTPRVLSPSRSKLEFASLVTILAGACLVYLLILTPERFGGYYDDSVYVTTAKALATGQGYRIISLPYEPAQTKYPPLYPFLLSLIWRAYSEFPDNLIWMMLLSIAATLIFLMVTRHYLITRGYASPRQALVVIALVGFNAWTLVFATSLVSEMLYAMLSVTALYLSEKHEGDKELISRGIVLGLVLGLAFLTRTSGLSLLLAVVAYFALRRKWKRLLLPAAISVAFVLGWFAWCHFNRTTAEGVNVAFYTNYFNDVREVVKSLQNLNDASAAETWLSIVGRNSLGLVLLSIPLVCSGLNNIWIPGYGALPVVVSLFFVLVIFTVFVAGAVRLLLGGVRLLSLYLVFYLSFHLPTPYTTYDRYLVPLLPFLILLLIRELSRLVSNVRSGLRSSRGVSGRVKNAFVGVAIVSTVAVTLYGYGSGIGRLALSRHNPAAASAEDQELYAWIKAHTDGSNVLICYRDPLYYLYSGRKAARSLPTTIIDGALFQNRPPTNDEERELITQIIRQNKGSYLITDMDDLDHLPDVYKDYFRELTRDTTTFVPVFTSSSGRSSIYRITNGG